MKNTLWSLNQRNLVKFFMAVSFTLANLKLRVQHSLILAKY